MKGFLSLLFCLLTGLAQAQTPISALRPDSATQRLTRSEIVLMPGVSQADLYVRAQAWLATAYQTTAAGTQKAADAVQGTGWREIEMVVSSEKSMPLNLWYTVTLAVQPGRYRYTITDFQTQHESTPTNTAPEKQAIEAVLRTEQALPPPRTDYSQQAAGVAQAVAETIKAIMDNPKATTRAESR
jgi:hypothetical protein